MSNLEDISYDSVCIPSGQSYKSYRTNLTPLYGKVWVDISFGYLLLFIPFIAGFLIPRLYVSWWWLAPAAVYSGYILAYIHLFVHEAAHFNIHPDKKKNDRLAGWLLCSLFALNIKNYRNTHWQHHLHLATPDDKEVSYFNALSLAFILKVLSGIHTIAVIRKRKETAPFKEQASGNGMHILRFVIMQAIFLSLAWFSGGWVLSAGWAIALVLVFPFFATIRQVLEHRDEKADTQKNFYTEKRNRISRLFGNDVFSRTFGGAGFNYHLLHHWDPQVSYTRLKDVLHFLKESPRTKDIIENSKTSYPKVFVRLFFAR